MLITTGGGSLAIPALLMVPGASAGVQEALVPYARETVDALLGGPQESYCSSRVARRLAMTAWERGRRDLPPDPSFAIGAACTASLATVATKRGEHRIVIAVQSLASTSVATLPLRKGERSRQAEELLAAALLLDRLSSHTAAPSSLASPAALFSSIAAAMLLPGETVAVDVQDAPLAWQELFLGTRRAVYMPGQAMVARSMAAEGRVIFPGSFDPLHDGHRRMAAIARQITGLPVEWELSVRNVDKPPLDFLEIALRTAQLAEEPVWLTAAATYLEKLELFPGAWFILGGDTVLRLGDARYYGGSKERADQAVRRIAQMAGGLVVFGRVRDGVFTDPAALAIPEPLRSICRFIPEAEFRDDVSSTQLRSVLGSGAEG